MRHSVIKLIYYFMYSWIGRSVSNACINYFPFWRNPISVLNWVCFLCIFLHQQIRLLFLLFVGWQIFHIHLLNIRWPCLNTMSIASSTESYSIHTIILVINYLTSFIRYPSSIFISRIGSLFQNFIPHLLSKDFIVNYSIYGSWFIIMNTYV